MKSLRRVRAIGYAILFSAARFAAAAPVGAWDFDESSGTAAADSSGNGLHATLTGSPSRVAGQAGNALRFDGGNYGRVPDSPLLDATAVLTVSFWVKPEGLDGTPQFILSKRTAANVNAAYSVFFNENNKLSFDINRNSSTGDRIESRTVFENDRWYQITLVYDGAAHPSQRARVFVDGKLDRQAAVIATSIPDHASDLYLGTGHAASTYRLKGVIDQLRISRELPSAPELAALHRGVLTLERWDDMNFTEVEKLVADPRFYQAPQWISYPEEAGRDLDWNYRGGRLRGWIEPPRSGSYVFWLSARASADFWLSTDETSFRKRRVARLSPMVGTGSGIKHGDPNRWDQFESQMSGPIALVAGTRYYFEVIAQTNHGVESHIHLAWAPEGGTREPVPPSAFGYHVIPSNDLDDDSLPDDWETLHQLDPSDNGLGDPAKQGERGDFDGDGLNNREEFLLGTNPAAADSDGDGMPDHSEVKGRGTDPLVSDLPAETIVHTIDLEDHQSAGTWVLLQDGLLGDNFRGSIQWNFTVPQAGLWIIQAATLLRGNVYDAEQVDVKVSIDGRYLGAHTLSYGASHQALLRLVTPHLGAGSHTLKLEIDNDTARRVVQIRSVDVRQPSGADGDANGVPDWVEALLGRTDTVASHSAYSRISPFCLEGNARLAGEVAVNGTPALGGTDESHWYFNLPLGASAPTPYTISYASGLTRTGDVFWQATNVLDGGTLPVRAGDSLKLGAWNGAGDGTAVITVTPVKPEGAVNGTTLVHEAADVPHGAGAARFAGNTYNHLSLPDDDELDGAAKLTISFRVKPSAAALDGLARGLVSKRAASNNEVAYSVFAFTGGRLFVDLDAGQGSPTRIDTGYTLTRDWQTVGVVFDGTLSSSQRVKVYVDGVLKKTASLAATSIRNRASNLHVGSLNAGFQYGGGPCAFDGLLDDVRIIRSALGATDAAALHQTGAAVPGTAAWFDFENPSALAADTGGTPIVHHVAGTGTAVQAFARGRSYHVSAVHSGGASGTLNVTVPAADLPAATSVLQNTLRYWVLESAKADPALVFQPGANLRLGARETVDAASYRYALYPVKGGNLGISARLSENGPIAAIARLNSIGLTGALQNDLVGGGSTDLAGYHIVTSPLLVTGLPPGGKVKITLFRAGIYFEDGSTVKTFDAGDFQDGVLQLRVLMDNDVEGGFCHYIDLYDAQGTLLGRR